MKKNLYFLLIFAVSTQLFSQYPSQKYALRGVWIASLGIDWPGTSGTTASDIAAQKGQLTQILDAHKSYGMNAMFFHVRPKCDAVYKSTLEPWSTYLTGQMGKAPSDPNYDPLQFAIQESHKRGMELHAWLNPYRAVGSTDDPNAVSSNHVTKLHPEWIIKCNGSEYRFLNPALPEVRAYLIKVIMDIVRRYDVDGIHFDDYFYPYASYGAFNDDASFNLYKGKFTDRALWRKNNVNLLLTMINDSIKAVKPWVKFGISPSGNPSVNQEIYCDAFGWLAGNYTDTTGTAHTGTPYIDYIMPQLYWVQYNGNLGSWSGASTLNGRHLYIGAPAYRYTESGFTPNELGWEIKTNRTVPTVKGEVYFSSKSLTQSNFAGCTDSLMHNYYVYPAITPKMSWLPGSSKKPNAPTNFRFEKNTSTGKYEFLWNKPAPATDGDTATVYVIYRLNTNQPASADLDDPTKMFGYTGQTVFSQNEGHYSVTSGSYYVVTAFDRYSNESAMSNVIQVNLPDQIPATPVLTSPADKDRSQSTYAVLKWSADPLAQSYQLQVAKDAAFTQITTNYFELKATTIAVYGIDPAAKYYWRVKTSGIGGSSAWSPVFQFESGIPVYPTLAEPKHTAGDIPLNPTLKWLKQDKATSYRVQVGTQSTMTTNIILDTTVTDTLVALKGLTTNKIYYWHVKSINSLGQSDWTQTWGFKTTATSAVKKDETVSVREYSLEQNYPNP
ncbi:MAG: family 10 glycosylhydrolase, partial [Bacillota bacterium]